MAGAHAGLVHRPVRCAAELACAEARGPQVRNDLALGGDDLVVLVDGHAGAQGGDANVLASAPERSLLDLLEILRVLAEVLVEAGVDELVVALDAGNQGIGGNLDLLGELLEGIGAVQVDEALDDLVTGSDGAVHLDLGHPLLDGVGGSGVEAHLRHGGLVVAVINLDEPTRLGLVAHLNVDHGEGHVLVHEAVAVHVHGHEGHGSHGARIEVVHHMAVTGLHHAGAELHGHEDAVASLAELLAVEAEDVGAVALDEAVVVLVIAGGEDDAHGGVELDVLAVGVLAHNAGHGAVLALDELDAGGLVVEVDAALLGQVGQGHDELEVALGLGAIVPLVADGLGTVLVHVFLGGDVCGRVTRLFGAQAQPAHGLTGVVGVVLHQAAVGAPVDALHVTANVVLDALGVAHLELDAALVGALGDADGLLLEHAGRGALLNRGQGRGHAAGAAAHHDDVIGVLSGELGDGGNLNGGALVVRGACALGVLDLGCGLVGQCDAAQSGACDAGGTGSLEEVPAVHLHRSTFLFDGSGRRRVHVVRGAPAVPCDWGVYCRACVRLDEMKGNPHAHVSHRMGETKGFTWCYRVKSQKRDEVG